MENNLNKIFAQTEPPKHLKAAVLRQIKLAQTRKLQREKRLFMFGFCANAAIFASAIFIFGKQLLVSDFWSIALLAFTDFTTVASYWQSLGMSLLETFPAISVVGILFPIFLFLFLVRQYVNQHLNKFTLKFLY